VNCVFVCSSLESGRDAVGDYCRGLAAGLKNLGHQTALVGLNDLFVAATEESRQPVPMLRLAHNEAWPTRVKRAKQFLDKCRAEWISFQFVSYGFHPKGLAHRLPRICAPLAAGRKVHVMFHEIWIGAKTNAPWKERVVGAVQKHMILHWLRDLNPRVVHATNAAYAGLLRAEGVHVLDLPLFGNIAPSRAPDFQEEIYRRAGVTRETRNRFWLFGIFGGVPGDWKLEPLLERLWRLAKTEGKKPVLIAFGKREAAGEKVMAGLAEKFDGRFPVVLFGSHSEERVSEFLQTIDFGIAAAPLGLLGKSSAAAAMLEHGLPLIVDRNDVLFRVPIAPEIHPRVILPDAQFERRLVAATKTEPETSRAQIVSRFVEDLQNAG